MKRKDFSEKFEVKGTFYQKEGVKYRRLLEIKSKKKTPCDVDLLVIMMNPGSSCPINHLYDNKLTITEPDDTQFQIMRVMERIGYNYAYIINLADNCESQSRIFIKSIKEKPSLIESIFFDVSKISKYIELEIPIILAWGVSKKLNPLVDKTIPFLKDKKCYAIKHKKDENSYRFYHPLPRNNKDQINWVRNMVSLIRNNKTVALL